MGLHYVYARELKPPRPASAAGSEPVFDTTSEGKTYCYKCHQLIIDRSNEPNGESRIIGLAGSKCEHCHSELNIHNTIWKL